MVQDRYIYVSVFLGKYFSNSTLYKYSSTYCLYLTKLQKKKKKKEPLT